LPPGRLHSQNLTEKTTIGFKKGNKRDKKVEKPAKKIPKLLLLQLFAFEIST
jgi:hypothetical protein